MYARIPMTKQRCAALLDKDLKIARRRLDAGTEAGDFTPGQEKTLRERVEALEMAISVLKKDIDRERSGGYTGSFTPKRGETCGNCEHWDREARRCCSRESWNNGWPMPAAAGCSQFEKKKEKEN